LTLVRRNRKSILTIFATEDFQPRQFEIAPQRRATNSGGIDKFAVRPAARRR
jgi:hypothetical protein